MKYQRIMLLICTNISIQSKRQMRNLREYTKNTDTNIRLNSTENKILRQTNRPPHEHLHGAFIRRTVFLYMCITDPNKVLTDKRFLPSVFITTHILQCQRVTLCHVFCIWHILREQILSAVSISLRHLNFNLITYSSAHNGSAVIAQYSVRTKYPS